jgi:putative transposase
MVTRRTSQRTFFLRPDKITQAIFAYCLAEAAQRFSIELIAWTLMSNHYHAIVHDVKGNLPKFIEHLHRLVAKVMNHRWDRTENLWSSTETSIVYLATREDILRKVIYVLTNPVAADLVERVTDWQGVSSSLDYLDGTKRTLHARPEGYFSKTKSVMPEEVGLQVKLPPIITDHETPAGWAERVRAGVGERENGLRVARMQERRKVRGWDAVVRTSPFASPTNPPHARTSPKRGGDFVRAQLRPAIASEEKLARIEQIRRLQHFRACHEEARRKFIAGDTTVEFPAGTYKMRLLGARCSPFPIAA